MVAQGVIEQVRREMSCSFLTFDAVVGLQGRASDFCGSWIQIGGSEDRADLKAALSVATAPIAKLILVTWLRR